MKYYLLAGEASGDLHGAALVEALLLADPSAKMRCWGGGLMEAAGAEVVKHYRDLAFMGFVEVLRNLPAILKNFRFAKSDITAYAPDCLILIDYPGFNLRMATWAKKRGLRVFYYISPQLWAWHTSRVNIVREAVERMFVIFPFEVAFYEKHGVKATFIGHPLMERVERHVPAPDFYQRNELSPGRKIVALLPGSRRQEVERVLTIMLGAATQFPEYQFVVAGANALEPGFYERFLQGATSVKLVFGQTYDLLHHAHAAMVTSGTATLETALFQVPQVVCYKAGHLSYQLARHLVNSDLKYISIVNLIADGRVVEELIQQDLGVEKLASSLRNILQEGQRKEILEGYQKVRAALGSLDGAGVAARHIVQTLKTNPR